MDGHTLVVGMGNPILSDDAVGLLVAQCLAERPLPDGVEVLQSEQGGLRLLELVRGFTRLIIIDALKSGGAPGEVVTFSESDFAGGHRYRSAHSISLSTALELGRRLGYEMPRQVTVFAIEADDVETFGERLSPPVAAAAARVVELVLAEIGTPAPAGAAVGRMAHAGPPMRVGRMADAGSPIGVGSPASAASVTARSAE
jgi:hydrogenase maturation protease